MANRYIDFSTLLAYQDGVVQTEGKSQPFGLIKLYDASTPTCPVLTPSLRAHLAKVEGRTSQYPALKEDAITTSSSESFTIPEHLSVSEMKSLTMNTIFCGFRVYPKWFENNLLDYGDYVRNKLDEVFRAMASAKETIMLAHLATNRTQVWGGVAQINNGDGTFAFDAATDQLDINLAAQKDVLFSNLKTLFGINKFPGETDIVVNLGGFNLALNEIFKFGQMNQENRQFIQNQLPTYYPTLGISPGSDQFSGYHIRRGSVGIAQNYPSDFRNPVQVGEKLWGITDTPVPYLNTQVNTFYNREAADASGAGETTAHLKMTHYEEWAFIDKFFLTSIYNSDLASRPNPIVKIVGATT